MSEEDFELDIDDIERRMNGALNILRQDFATLRTGRASAGMLERIDVNAYGSQLPISQCGTINVPEPRMLTVNVWDKTIVNEVVKALNESGLGINPVVEGTHIRLPIPELNEERRRELSRVAAQKAESAKISIRNIRRDGVEKIRKAKNEGMSEDEMILWIDELQDMTDKAVTAIDQTLETKKTEIMAV